MPTRIIGVSDRLIECAQKEFLDKGYSNASVRSIAAAAHTSTRAIYTRFTDKKGLFSSIAQPIYEEFISQLTNYCEEYWSSYQNNPDTVYSNQIYYDVIKYAYLNLDVTKMILSCSEVSPYCDFIEKLADINSNFIFSNVIFANDTSPDYYFFHMIIRSFYDGLFEPIRHDLKEEDALTYTKHLVDFFEKGLRTT